MASVEPYWVQAARRKRVWADTHDTHKMGWVNPGDQMRVVEEYNTWLRFDEHNAIGINPFVEGYKEWWIRSDAVEKIEVDQVVPPPDPNPDVVPPYVDRDAELGAAFRTVGDFLAGLFRGWGS